MLHNVALSSAVQLSANLVNADQAFFITLILGITSPFILLSFEHTKRHMTLESRASLHDAKKILIMVYVVP